MFSCQDGFEGQYCELVVESCDNSHCINGKCVNNACKCNQGWEGENCEYAACNICANGGQCYIDSHNSSRCKCPEGYDPSTNCREQCNPSECEECGTTSGGTTCMCGEHSVHKEYGCVPLCTHKMMSLCSTGICSMETKLCNCTESGVVCAIEDECICQNGAETCEFHFKESTRTKCNCLEGFLGNHCEIKRNTSLCTCLNEGICKLKNASYYCECPNGFIGKQCEIPQPTITCETGTGDNCDKQINGSTKSKYLFYNIYFTNYVNLFVKFYRGINYHHYCSSCCCLDNMSCWRCYYFQTMQKVSKAQSK